MGRSTGEKIFQSLPDDFIILTTANSPLDTGGKMIAMQVIEAPTFDGSNCILNGKTRTDLNNLGDLPEGSIWYWNFSKISITAGKLVLYTWDDSLI